MNNYGSCSGFKICNENEDFLREDNDNNEKDYSQMIMNTPPSNINKANQYGIIVNSTHNGIGIFTCTPKEDN